MEARAVTEQRDAGSGHDASAGAHRGLRLAIVDGHSLFRQSLRHVLEEQPDLDVVAEAASGREAIREARRSLPDVAIVDGDIAAPDAIAVVRRLREEAPGARVVMLVPADRHGLAVEALEAGADGIVVKESPVAELVEAIRDVSRGDIVIARSILRPLIQSLIHRRRDEDVAQRLVARLTRREREVLALVADGGDNDTIGRALHVSPETARTHIQNILRKLGVHSRLEAAALARLTGGFDDPATEGFDAGTSATGSAERPSRLASR